MTSSDDSRRQSKDVMHRQKGRREKKLVLDERLWSSKNSTHTVPLLKRCIAIRQTNGFILDDDVTQNSSPKVIYGENNACR